METTDYTYEHLLPALFNDKDICIDYWVDCFFSSSITCCLTCLNKW
jgi:hypothetical protein